MSLFADEFRASKHIRDRRTRLRALDWEGRLAWMASERWGKRPAHQVEPNLQPNGPMRPPKPCEGNCCPRPPVREPWELEAICRDQMIFGEARVRFDPPIHAGPLRADDFEFFNGDVTAQASANATICPAFTRRQRRKIDAAARKKRGATRA